MGKLTQGRIRQLKEPGRYSDGDGLFRELNRPGKGNWQLRATVNGRRRDIGLGPLDLITVHEARELAIDVRRDIKRGIDPIEERKRKKIEILTFKEAATKVHAEHKASWKNGKHQDQWINTLETYAFPKLGDRLVNDIEGPLIREVLLDFWLEKPETARRVKQRIGVVLDWAYANGMRATEAPMRSLSRALPRQPKQDGHFAAMLYEDVPTFLKHLHKRTSVVRLALEFLILTASRSDGGVLTGRRSIWTQSSGLSLRSGSRLERNTWSRQPKQQSTRSNVPDLITPNAANWSFPVAMCCDRCPI